MQEFKDYILDDNMINAVTPRGSLLNYTIIEGREKEALWLIENGIVTNGKEMKDNPLVIAIRFSNAFLVEELMKNCRNLIIVKLRGIKFVKQ